MRNSYLAALEQLCSQSCHSSSCPAPTYGLTIFPSTAPTSAPTSTPSSTQTIMTTQLPSSMPSSIPNQTIMPISTVSSVTAAPSATPTVAPTLSPSMSPTLTPTSSPTSTSSLSPTSSPSLSPTTSPSLSPISTLTTLSPSLATPIPSSPPSLEPTSIPSVIPSLTPSMVPTMLPTVLPTAMPTAVPTVLPTVVPFAMPTAVPSAMPTYQSPTIVPSPSSPIASLPPTASPVFSSTALVKVFQNELANITSQVLYQDLFVSGSQILGSCAAWTVGTGSTLTVLTVSQKITNVTLITYDARSTVQARVSCDHATSALAIINSISSSTATLSSILCAAASVSHTWNSRMCSSGKVAVCVDCIDPCGTAQCSDLQSLNPCGHATGNAYGCAQRNSSVNAYRVLTVTHQALAVAPMFKSLVATPTRTTVSMLITLVTPNGKSTDGAVFCAYYAAGVAPTSTASILLKNYGSASTSSVANVIMSGLDAAARYDIYCVAQSNLGTTMVLADALLSKQRIKTSCCKIVTVTSSILSLYQLSNAIDAVQVTLDSLPADSLTLTLSTVVGGASSALVPAKTSVVSTVTTSLFRYSIAPTSSASLGVATLAVTLGGTSSVDYQVVYVNRNFTVLSLSVPPPVPVLLSVLFSSDGIYLSASFSAKTDKASISSATFACSALFSFVGSGTALCKWTSPSTVTVSLGSAATISVGDVITLLADKVKALCVSSTTMCAAYSYAAAAAATVGPPLEPTVPVVSISAPSIIGKCDSMTIDLSSSTGGSGRNWESVVFDVQASSGNSTKVQSFLNNNYIVSPPTPVPSGSFPTGLIGITVTLCNFLGSCGKGTLQLTVTTSNAPMVLISGTSLLSTTTAAGLILNADAFVSACSGNVSRAGLSYSWAAYKNGAQDFSIVSTSKQYYSFKLGPYTLAVNTLYTFTLTVLDAATLKSSVKSVQVNIVPSTIVAVISGGSTLAMLRGSSVTLDASSSYDKDKSGVTGSAAGLSYIWSCVTIAPSVSESCGIILPAITTTRTLLLLSNSTASDSTSTLTVTVYDSTRSSTSSTSVTVQSPSIPLVIIKSSSVLNFNQANQLVLVGTVKLIAAGTAAWSLNDSSVNIATSSLSPVAYALPVGLSTVTLTMNANSLSIGSTLSFALSSTAGGFTSTSNVIISVNSPPVSGVFIVSPSSGRELLDHFSLSASRWFDADLPLQYAFGYTSATGSLVMQGISQVAFSSTILPAGQDTSDFNVSCQARIYDSVLAFTSASVIITVKPVVIPASALLSLVSSSLADLSSPVAAAQVFSTATSIVNSVSCVGQPVATCLALNRLACSKMANTCGVCRAGYLGDLGYSNSACIPSPVTASGLVVSSLLRSAVTVCADGTTCTGYAKCTSGLCVVPSKSCINSCSGNGTCSFSSIDTGLTVSYCLVDDTRCRAVCNCNAGRKGISCDTSAAVNLSNQKLRLTLLNGLMNLTSSQDASLATVTGWVTSVSSLTQNYGELSGASALVVVQIISNIIASSSQLNLPYDQVSSVLSSIDDISLALAVNGSTAASYGSTALFKEYSFLVLSQMSASQFDIVKNYNSFKTIYSIKTVADSAVTLATPLTASESAAGVSSTSLTLATSSGLSNVKLSLLLLRRSALTSQLASSVHSDPIIVMLPDASVCATAGCGFTVNLQTVDNATYVNGSSSAATYVTSCSLTPSSTVYACPNGLNVTAVCDGMSVTTLTSKCPYIVTNPVCGRITSTSSANDICATTSHSSTQTTCKCVVSSAVLASSRKLWSARADIERRELSTSGFFELGTITSQITMPSTTTSSPVSATPTGSTGSPTLDPTPSSSPTAASYLASSGLDLQTVIILATVIPGGAIMIVLALLCWYFNLPKNPVIVVDRDDPMCGVPSESIVELDKSMIDPVDERWEL